MAEQQTPGNRTQLFVPTYSRVWQYRWVIRGIPNGPTFWRPVEGRAAVTFGAVLLVIWMITHQLRVKLGIVGWPLVHLGIPALAALYVTRAKLAGKRLDRWLTDRMRYRTGPKRFDRFRTVPAPVSVEISGNVQVVEDDEAAGDPAAGR